MFPLFLFGTRVVLSFLTRFHFDSAGTEPNGIHGGSWHREGTRFDISIMSNPSLLFISGHISTFPPLRLELHRRRRQTAEMCRLGQAAAPAMRGREVDRAIPIDTHRLCFFNDSVNFTP